MGVSMFEVTGMKALAGRIGNKELNPGKREAAIYVRWPLLRALRCTHLSTAWSWKSHFTSLSLVGLIIVHTVQLLLKRKELERQKLVDIVEHLDPVLPESHFIFIQMEQKLFLSLKASWVGCFSPDLMHSQQHDVNEKEPSYLSRHQKPMSTGLSLIKRIGIWRRKILFHR